ncbi:hypothetical protein Salat_2404100 [Sesamum alatum]|uniref:C2 NT-type domain-containing protein n=1 Tax=Sesamum alatum TaxID=300844 RepID=A0AAE2CF84_9LAMI|nr:hypothetical protein Salat_2404100 [Sesamum alatum]
MAVKIRKWSPWPPASTPRKFQVAVKPIKLEGLLQESGDGDGDGDGGGRDDETQKFVAIKIKWKGEPKFLPLMPPFQSRPKREVSSERIVNKGSGRTLDWEEDKWFENTCCFSVVSNHHDPKFGVWLVTFSVVCRETMGSNSKAKMAVIGRVSINISEIAWNMDSNSTLERKLPLSLQIDGVSREATLTVLFNFVEIREHQDSAAIAPTKSILVKGSSVRENVKARRRSLSQEEVMNLDESDESGSFTPTSLSNKSRGPSPSVVLDPDKKEGWFSWKSRHFSFKRAKTKEEKLDESCIVENKIDPDLQCSTSSSVDPFNDGTKQKDDPAKPCLGSEHQDSTAGAWEEKELISRDGQAKLKASVFFASFDQRSDKAAGGSACTALVVMISHWLHSNSDSMPDRLEFDNLIMQGSSEWRKLCENAAYVNDFPNKHFDLETILRADIRPISVSHNKSFVGFFGAEAFESLKGAMSFDDIWNEFSSNTTAADDSAPRIYIVSWNDHFFVLKAEAHAYYIIDTLGERLFEGCNQAYILRFDDKAIMRKRAEKEKTDQSKNEASETEEQEEIICSGKECCREFIKRFLAAIPLKELEEDEKKKGVSYLTLHHRLQIEFNYSCSSSLPPSSTSSPISSVTTTASSTFSE